MVHQRRARTASLVVAPILCFVLVLALAGPAAAAPGAGAGESPPIVTALRQISHGLQDALFGWIGSVWDRAANDQDPNGAPSSAAVGTSYSGPDRPGAVWDRAATDLDPNGAPSSATAGSPQVGPSAPLAEWDRLGNTGDPSGAPSSSGGQTLFFEGPVPGTRSASNGL